ncbi:MAG: translational GTPase TypA [Gammaproteobacteria bacterium]|nr:translational GTPase TypA [Gammaproteobacteria bacterium]
MSIERLRNLAIIAHVDHGKTTLVDRLLQQSGTLGERYGPVERVMDTNDLEKERGITILSKNASIQWKGFRINIVDTPGHADFGGEVERVLSMVDSVLLLVDVVEGPMPQTRFVTQKAFSHGLRPIVVLNKIDRDGARPDWVLDQTFDLFDRLGASDEQLDFPVVYASSMEGYASLDAGVKADDMRVLFETIVNHVPPPGVDAEGPFQMQVSSLDYSKYVGTIGIGRVTRGRIGPKSPVAIVGPAGEKRMGRVLQIFGFHGLEKREVATAGAGDIVAVTGIDALGISDTLCDPSFPDALPSMRVDEPTVRMNFQVNTSPFSGRDGKFVTSRQLGARLGKEAIHNVALRVEQTDDADVFAVSGRGELHLTILLETLRREGYEMAVSRPKAIYKRIDGVLHEPWEELSIDLEESSQGAIMETLGKRGGKLQDMQPGDRGRVRLLYKIPSRGLIGFHTEFMTLTSGTGLICHVFDRYAPTARGEIANRRNGTLVSMANGKALAFALFNLQERGRLFIHPNTEVYEGQIIGVHARDNDLVVNPLKGKQLTNIRAAGKDDAVVLEPPVPLTLEYAVEFIDDDELVEITPGHIRVRKKQLKEHERRQFARRLKARTPP